eukprot:jgi/Chlat1/3379/Chrsp23S03728
MHSKASVNPMLTPEQSCKLWSIWVMQQPMPIQQYTVSQRKSRWLRGKETAIISDVSKPTSTSTTSPPTSTPTQSNATVPDSRPRREQEDINTEWARVLPPPPESLTVVFGSVAVKDFIINWVQHVRKHPGLTPYVVIAMDEELMLACEALGFSVISARGAEIIGDTSLNIGKVKQVLSSKQYYRNDFQAFKKMGAVKAEFLRMLLAKGYDVLVSDADTVWLGNPWPLLGRTGVPTKLPEAKFFQHADVLVTSDCINRVMDMKADVMQQEINTGVLFMRSTAASIALCAEWQKRSMETTDGHDQMEFNRILRGGYGVGVECRSPACVLPYEDWPLRPYNTTEGVSDWPGGTPERQTELRAAALRAYEAHEAEGAREVFYMWGGRVTVGILPILKFVGGHTYFVQRIQGRDVLNVHCTYQFGDSPTYMFGKRQRLREAGLWLVDPDEYYRDGKFVVVTGLEGVIERALQVDSYPRAVRDCTPEDTPVAFNGRKVCWHPAHIIPPGTINLRAAMDPAKPHCDVQIAQRRVLRAAMAVSEASGRTLVLPQLWSFHDRDWWMSRDGRMNGAGLMSLPFPTPLDQLFDIEPWYYVALKFREPSFMSNPKVPKEVRDSPRVVLSIGASNNRKHMPSANKRVVVLPLGANFDAAGKVDIPERVVEIGAEDLLSFSPCGFADPRAAKAFADKMANIFAPSQVEYCGYERNPFIKEIADVAFATGEELGRAFAREFNCTGKLSSQQPVNINPAPLEGCASQDAVGRQQTQTSRLRHAIK